MIVRWFKWLWVLALMGLFPARADDMPVNQAEKLSQTEPTVSYTPAFYYGPYASAMGSYMEVGDHQLSNSAIGGAFALGWRRPKVGIELEGSWDRLKAKGTDGGLSSYGGEIAVLGFPIKRDQDFYLLLGGGVAGFNNQKSAAATFSNSLLFDIGLGQMLTFHIGQYQMGLRMEARFRHEQVSKSSNPDDPTTTDNPPPGDSTQIKYNDVVARIGLQFPFGKRHQAEGEPSIPVQVVPVKAEQTRSTTPQTATPSAVPAEPVQDAPNREVAPPAPSRSSDPDLDSILNANPSKDDKPTVPPEPASPDAASGSNATGEGARK